MTQVASYQVPAHPSGLDMRTQLNAIVLAILGDNCGPTAPTVTYPGMMWGDTTALRLKRRDNANANWINIGPLDNFLGDVSTSVTNKVSKTGDTMTAALTMFSSGVISAPTYYSANGYAPHFRSNNQVPGFEWVNSANTVVIASLTDTGLYTCTNMSVGSTGSVYFPHTKGRMWIRGDGGIGANGGMGFINNAGNNWRFQLTDEGNYQFFGYHNGVINVSNSIIAPDTNGYQTTIGPGYIKLNEYTNGAWIDFARARSEDYRWRVMYTISNDGLYFYNKGTGTQIFTNDGSIQCNNLYSSASGGWLSTLLANKTVKGTQIVWAAGIRELGALAPGGGDVIADAGNPWALEGLRCTGGGATWIWPRAIWYAAP